MLLVQLTMLLDATDEAIKRRLSYLIKQPLVVMANCTITLIEMTIIVKTIKAK